MEKMTKEKKLFKNFDLAMLKSALSYTCFNGLSREETPFLRIKERKNMSKAMEQKREAKHSVSQERKERIKGIKTVCL